jgi:uncharacterized protein with GYD domain
MVEDLEMSFPVPETRDDGENCMPKYLMEVRYTAEGAKGLLKDGGTKRRAAAKALVESVGGTLESMYYAFGSTDVVVISDMPDATAAAAASIALAASGGVTTRSTMLLTPEEIDTAVKKSATYTPPGR